MKIHSLLLNALALASVPLAAHAATITNGTFTSYTTSSPTLSTEFGARCVGSTYCQTASVTGWSSSTSNGYNFVFVPGHLTANSIFGTGNVTLVPAVTADPFAAAGSNFLALDGEPTYSGAVSTLINSVTVGTPITVTFDYAFTEQQGYSGASPQTLAVSVNGAPGVTETLTTLPASGFTGWSTASFTFTPTSATDTLSFLASGPSGAPPFALISNVAVSSPSSVTPEPSSLALLSTGLFGVAGFVRSRFKNKK